jgi:hypothetical protein
MLNYGIGVSTNLLATNVLQRVHQRVCDCPRRPSSYTLKQDGYSTNGLAQLPRSPLCVLPIRSAQKLKPCRRKHSSSVASWSGIPTG